MNELVHATNLLIDLFMAEFQQHESDKLNIINDLTVKGHDPISYHEYWDCLMPVAEKIIELDCDEGKFYRQMCQSLANEQGIAGVYNAVVCFVEWYNENEKQNQG